MVYVCISNDYKYNFHFHRCLSCVTNNTVYLIDYHSMILLYFIFILVRYFTDYQQYLDKATEEGVVDTQWSNVSVAGASGTGKTAFSDLLLLNDPVLIHNSTPILHTMDVCIVDKESSSTKNSTQKKNSTQTKDKEESSDEEETADNEEDVPVKTKEMSQHTILADSSDEHLWKVAKKDDLLKTLAEAVHILAKEVSRCPDRLPPFCPKSIGEASVNTIPKATTPTPSTNPDIFGAQPITYTRDQLTARQLILELLPKLKQCSAIDLAHWIHLLDTGGQANFIDIAPALFRFNSVNIVLHKLDEELDDLANFFYSIDGKVVGREKRSITNAQLLRSLFTSRMGVKPPNLEGLAGVEIKGEAQLVVLGTHYDKYREKLEKGEKLESLRDKNDRLLEDFKDFKKHIIAYKSEKRPAVKKDKHGKRVRTKAEKAQLIFPVNSLSREDRELLIAKKIRKLVSGCYIRAKIPIRWFLIQIEINELKSSKEDIVVVSTIVSMGYCLEMSKQEVLAALRYFHDLTVCLYFPDVLPNIVFLSPNRLFKKLTELASVTLRVEDSTFPLGISDPLQQKGIFTRAIFDLFPEGFKADVFTVDDFLKLMEHLLVICRLPDGVSYYMPSVLESIDNPIDDLEEAFFIVNPLCLSWNESVPVGVFPSLTQYLLGHTSDKFKPNPQEADNYRNRVSLIYTSTYDDVVMFEMPHFIGIAHTAPPSESSLILSQVYNGIHHIVRACNMKEEICHPTQHYLCRIEGCRNPSKLHLCDITGDNNTLVCSLDHKKKMSIDKISHQPWKGMKNHFV